MQYKRFNLAGNKIQQKKTGKSNIMKVSVKERKRDLILFSYRINTLI